MVSQAAPQQESTSVTLERKWASASLEPLWVGGLALLCLIPGYLLTPSLSVISPRAGVWAQYLALGTLFPALLAAIVLLERAGRRWSWHATLALAVIPIVAISILAGPQHAIAAAGLAIVQSAICVLVAARDGRLHLSQRGALFVTAYAGWAAVLEALTWQDLADILPTPLPLVLAVGIALVACSWWLFGPRPVAVERRRWVDMWLVAGCLIVLVLLAFRTDGLYTTDRLGPSGTFYHWGALVGPAEAVRQGGWILWDTPSPYGFLMMLTLAAFPAPSAWQSLYLLNAGASALLAIWVFLTLRAVNPGIVGTLLGAAASAATVFFLTVRPPALMPEHYMPMSGAFRYGWAYVLVAVLLFERTLAPGSRRQQVALVGGCLCWLCSALWSIENAFVGSAVWLPAFALIVLRDRGTLSGRRAWRGVVAWLAIPPLLLIAALAALVLVYRVALGHGPDLYAYVEAALTFSGAEFAQQTGMYEGLAPNRTILVLVLAFLLLAMSATYVALSAKLPRSLPTLVGMALGLWGLSSYPLGLATPFTPFRMLPFALLGLAFALLVAASWNGHGPPVWVVALRSGTVPLLAGIVVIVYTNGAALSYYAAAIRQEGFHGRDITAALPRVEPQLQRLLQEAAVGANDPILYAGARFGDMMPVWTPAGADMPVAVSQQWLAGPIADMALHPDMRKQVFMQRRADRQQSGGWLIERQDKKRLIFTTGPWFFSQVDASFVPAKFAANDDWRLIWYEPREGRQASFAERSPSAVPPMLPSDLAVNGVPLAGQALPRVWGFYGPEWTVETRQKTWRCAPGRGTIGIYAPSRMAAELAFSAPPGLTEIDVAVNDGPVTPAAVGRGRNALASLVLDAGWNMIVLSKAESGRSSAQESAGPAGCTPAEGQDLSLQISQADLRFPESALSP